MEITPDGLFLCRPDVLGATIEEFHLIGSGKLNSDRDSELRDLIVRAAVALANIMPRGRC